MAEKNGNFLGFLHLQKANERMTQKPALYKNILANFFGSTWTGLVALIFLPYYLRLMGGEAFAIIGFFITLANIMSVLDFGVSSTLNRELAACAVHNSHEKMRNTLRSLEYLYLPTIFFIALILLSFSSMIANQWLNNNQLPTFVIEQSLMIMAVVIALHLSINFYAGGLYGLQFQVVLNIINIIMVALRYMAVVPVMLYFSPSPVVFFIWQLIINFIHLLLLRGMLWSKICKIQKSPSFELKIIRKIWRFSFGVSVINLLGMITINIDKILLSKLLTLEEFGYYSLASIIAMSIAPRLASPFFAAVYPRFTQYVKDSNTEQIIRLYHRASLAVATIIIPVTVFISFYATRILFLWTGSPIVSEYADSVLILLSLGCMFTAIMYIPYALQLAYGWTRLGIFTSTASIISLVTLIFFLYPKYGVNGVALSWLIVNSVVAIIGISIMHKYLMSNKDGVKWLIYDNGYVLAVVLISSTLLKNIFTAETLLELLLVLMILYLVPILGISSQRKSVVNLLRTILRYEKN